MNSFQRGFIVVDEIDIIQIKSTKTEKGNKLRRIRNDQGITN